MISNLEEAIAIAKEHCPQLSEQEIKIAIAHLDGLDDDDEMAPVLCSLLGLEPEPQDADAAAMPNSIARGDHQ